MRVNNYILASLLTVTLLNFQSQSDLETEKYLNFVAAVKNRSTFSYFTVIKVKNLNSGEVKEICTKGSFVNGAIHIELNLGYDSAGGKKALDFLISKKDRYFEFKNKKALKNISFFDYKINLVEKIQNEYDFDKVIEIITKENEFGIRLPNNEMKAFAHVLFNKGFMTGENNCVGGALEYVVRNKSRN